MHHRSFHTSNAVLFLLIFALGCPAASFDTPSSPPLSPKTYRRQSNTSSMPNAIRSAHHREELIRAILAQREKEAADPLISAIANLTDGYNGPVIEEIVHHLSSQARGSSIEASDATEPLSRAVARYDRDNPAAIEAKSRIISLMAESNLHPETQPEPSYPLLQHVHQIETATRAGQEIAQMLGTGSLTPSDCRSILFCGPPGVGKTHMIRAIANESNCTLEHLATPALTKMYQAGGETALQELLVAINNRIKPSNPAALLHLDRLGSLEFFNSHAPGSLQEALITLWKILNRRENHSKKVICIGECTKYLQRGDHFHARLEQINFPPLSEAMLKQVMLDTIQYHQLEFTQEQISRYAQEMHNSSPEKIIDFIQKIKKGIIRVNPIAPNNPPQTNCIDQIARRTLSNYSNDSDLASRLAKIHLPELLKRTLHEITLQLKRGVFNQHHPRVLLFCGPPGTGKTMAIEAICAASGCKVETIDAEELAQGYKQEKNRAIRNLLNGIISSQREGQQAILHLDKLQYLQFEKDTKDDSHHKAFTSLCKTLQGYQYRSHNILCIGECNLYSRTRDYPGPRLQRIPFERPTQELLRNIFTDHVSRFDIPMNEEQIDRCLSYMHQWSGGEVARFLENIVLDPQLNSMELNDALDTLLTEITPHPLLQHMHQPPEIMRIVRNLIEQLKTGTLEQKTKRGLILHGPSGVGKSAMAYAMANEANCQLISGSASDLVNKYQGSGATAIRHMFAEAIVNRRAGLGTIIFLDELEGIQASGEDADRHHSDTRKAMTTLWTQLNACEQDRRRHHILFIAACNDFNCLDFRIKRRCQKLKFGMPTQEMLKQIMLDKAIEFDFSVREADINKLLPKMNGWSGASATSVIGEAKELLVRDRDMLSRAFQDELFYQRIKLGVTSVACLGMSTFAGPALAVGFVPQALAAAESIRNAITAHSLLLGLGMSFYPSPAISPLELSKMALILAHKKEQTSISENQWSNTYKRMRHARPITTILAVGCAGITGAIAYTVSGSSATAFQAGSFAGSLGGAMGSAADNFLFDQDAS